MADTATVLIVDDDEAVREALVLLLESAGFVTRAHTSGRELLESQPPQGPTCLLLDLQMPGLNGLEVQESLQASGFDTPVIFLTAHGDIPAAVKALKGGAIDFLQKPGFRRDELIQRVRQAVDRHRDMLEQKAGERRLSEQIGRLSAREIEVARLAAAGKANKVIGAELGISERTVEVHRGRVMKKLGLRSVVDLASLADHLSR